MELQAVILAAGRGSRMTDLTSCLPKPLIPIANKPMIWYPINMLEKAGFDEVIIVTLDSTKSTILRALKSTQIQIKMDFVTVSGEDDLGTADSLRILNEQRKIKNDVLIVSCDLITDVALHKLADVHRTYDATVTALMMSLPEQTAESVTTVPGTKSKRKLESRDLVGLDEKGQRVLFMAAEADMEDFLMLRKSILEKHPFIRVGTNLLDAHMYIFKKWVIDYLCEHRHISSVKGELIPSLVKKQFIKKQPKDVVSEGTIMEETNNKNNGGNTSEDDLKVKTIEMSSWNEGGITKDSKASVDAIKCHAFIMNTGFCSRANSLAAYCDVNRQILQSKYTLDDDFIHSTAKVKAKTQVGQDSMVGEESVIGEKVSVKRSVIGQHCNIGDKVKIANSIIMDHVTIKEGCVIHGSVICGNASLSEQVELKDCLVGSKQTLPEKAKFSNEIVIDNDYMMEI